MGTQSKDAAQTTDQMYLWDVRPVARAGWYGPGYVLLMGVLLPTAVYCALWLLEWGWAWMAWRVAVLLGFAGLLAGVKSRYAVKRVVGGNEEPMLPGAVPWVMAGVACFVFAAGDPGVAGELGFQGSVGSRVDWLAFLGNNSLPILLLSVPGASVALPTSIRPVGVLARIVTWVLFRLYFNGAMVALVVGVRRRGRNRRTVCTKAQVAECIRHRVFPLHALFRRTGRIEPLDDDQEVLTGVEVLETADRGSAG